MSFSGFVRLHRGESTYRLQSLKKEETVRFLGSSYGIADAAGTAILLGVTQEPLISENLPKVSGCPTDSRAGEVSLHPDDTSIAEHTGALKR